MTRHAVCVATTATQNHVGEMKEQDTLPTPEKVSSPVWEILDLKEVPINNKFCLYDFVRLWLQTLSPPS